MPVGGYRAEYCGRGLAQIRSFGGRRSTPPDLLQSLFFKYFSEVLRKRVLFSFAFHEKYAFLDLEPKGTRF